MSSEQEERRNSVRITDRVLFSYAPVSQERLESIRADFQKGIPLYNQAGLGDVQMFVGAQSALAKLREQDRNLAEFLLHLDNKINMVLQALQGKDSKFHSLASREISLGGGGIAFFADSELDLDTPLEQHIVLLPSYTYIYCFGKVVSRSAQKDEEGNVSYRIGSEFLLIMEEDREKFIQHTFHRQSLALRNRRLGN